jgi:pyruvate formate lyase activating enzyme
MASAGLDATTVLRRDLVAELPSGKLECRACAHRCKLGEGRRGVCLVRSREGDSLRVPWGYVAGLAVDPIEKKPFFHVVPGGRALSFGMLGCDLHCSYCQNWLTSQSLRDERAVTRVHPADPSELVAAALDRGCRVLVSTYNEPLITAEWAVEIFRHARAAGLITGFVSNGHATAEVLTYLQPVTDLYKVDLKSFRESSYRSLGGRLQAVLESIAELHRLGLWLEVVTLVVPGFNDEDEELADIAGFLAAVSPDIPWHVTAFHPDYRMADRDRTSAVTLARARRIGHDNGLRYVYAGNLPGELHGGEDTHCPSCDATLVRRRGFSVLEDRIGGTGQCPECGTEIAGRW